MAGGGMEIFRVQELITNLQSRVSSLASFGDWIFVGTQDGQVSQYVVEKTSDGIKGVYIEKKRFLNHGKKPVEQILALEGGVLLTLCDGQVDVLSASSLDVQFSFTSIKNAQVLCTDKRAAMGRTTNSGVRRLCVVTKKHIALFESNAISRWDLRKELDVANTPQCVEWVGPNLFLGLKKSYLVLEWETGKLAELTIPLGRASPAIKVLDKEVLFRSEAGGLLIDANDASTSRGKIVFATPPIALGFAFPYIVSLQAAQVEVHSAYDQSLLQRVDLPAGGDSFQFLGDGSYFCLGGGTRVCVLAAPAVERQLKEFLRTKRVVEAIDLFKRVVNPEHYEAKLRRFHVEVGMALFTGLQFQRAFEYFLQSDVQPHQILYFYPHLLPAQIARNLQPTDDIPTLVRKFLGGSLRPEQESVVIARYREEARAQAYLEKTRRPDQHDLPQQIIDTALVKIYAESPAMAGQMLAFLGQPHNVLISEVQQWCLETRRYRALALILEKQRMYREALDVWRRLGTGEYREPEPSGDPPGLDDTVEFLSRTNELDLVWEYAPWALKARPERAIFIFVRNAALQAQAERVLEFLAPFGGQVCQRFLEHLVETGSPEERFHTRLALMYLDTILALLPPDPAQSASALSAPGAEAGLLGRTRRKLKVLLEMSTRYDAVQLMARVADTPLYDEVVLLHSKLGEHKQALRILVSQLRDYKRAEQYCLAHKDSDDELFLWLFKVYLGRLEDDGGGSSGAGGRRKPSQALPQQALRLLETYPVELPPSKVLGLLPPSYPLEPLGNYLKRSLQCMLHLQRDSLVLRNLNRTENLQQKCRLAEIKSVAIPVTKDRICPICSRRINEEIFAYFPDGTLTHFKCAKENKLDAAGSGSGSGSAGK